MTVFWSGTVSLSEAWMLPEYSHGPLIPILSLILFLRHLKTVPPATGPIKDRSPGLLVIGAALFLALLGNISRIPDVVTYGMIVWVYGILLVGFGWRRGRQFWPPVLHLAFMLPLPAVLYWQVSSNLQMVSSELGVAIIRALDVPVFLDGNIIDLGIYKLHVAEACSGLRYLFPVMSFSYVFAVLYQGPLWIKTVLLLSAAPITILMNAVRIGITGFVVDAYGISAAEGFMHLFEGWFIFITCVLVLIGLAIVLQRVTGDRRPLYRALDLDVSGLRAQAARGLKVKSSVALVACALMTAGLAGIWHLAPERTVETVSRDSLVFFPRQLSGWSANTVQKLDPEIERVLGADDYALSSYTLNGGSPPVDLFVAWYAKQTEGSGIHSPEVCLPGGGWEMSEIKQVSVAVVLPDGKKTAVPVNRAVIQNGLEQRLVYYWFEQRGRRLTSAYLAKAVTLFDAVALGRTDGALVRIDTPILVGDAPGAADARLQDFLGASLAVLPDFVPQ